MNRLTAFRADGNRKGAANFWEGGGRVESWVGGGRGLEEEKGSGGETPQPRLRGVGSERGGFDPELVELKMRKDMEW